MQAGQWYTCHDPELAELQSRARAAVHEHNTLPPDQRGAIAPGLRYLFASVGEGAMIETQFHCAYGLNISLGASAYLNAGCTILDTAPVTIGARSMLGPRVQIYCANHHKDAEKRVAGLEIALPVSIGNRVWIGGGAILLPGVSIGDDAIIGAGSVVTHNVAPGVTVVGNPAHPIKPG